MNDLLIIWSISMVGGLWVANRLQWLTLGGSIAAGLLAIAIILTFGVAFLIFPVSFLLLGSALSKLNKGKVEEHDDTNGRNIMQVLSNGLPALIICAIYTFYHQDFLIHLFIASFNVALSDTAASEIGRYYQGVTWDMTTMKRIPSGVSGGISWAGTIGALAFAMILPLTAWHIGYIQSWNHVLTIGLVGFVGMWIDSILGSTVQAKYKIHGRISDFGSKYQRVSGIHCIDNNMVNLISISITILIYFFTFGP